MMSLISISLGVTNLLPIPALDGGKILILIIEAIRRKPLKEQTEINIQLLGFSMKDGQRYSYQLAFFGQEKNLINYLNASAYPKLNDLDISFYYLNEYNYKKVKTKSLKFCEKNNWIDNETKELLDKKLNTFGYYKENKFEFHNRAQKEAFLKNKSFNQFTF